MCCAGQGQRCELVHVGAQATAEDGSGPATNASQVINHSCITVVSAEDKGKSERSAYVR